MYVKVRTLRGRAYSERNVWVFFNYIFLVRVFVRLGLWNKGEGKGGVGISGVCKG